MFFTRSSRKSSNRVSKTDSARRRKLFFESLEERRVLAVFSPVASTNSGGNTPYNAAVADFDNDGDTDIAVANIDTVKPLGILLNNGNGTFVTTSFSAGGLAAYNVIAGDFDNDGDQDVAMTTLSSTGTFIMKNNGSGSFSHFVTIPAGSHAAYNIFTGDFNEDGNLDLVTGRQGVAVYFGNGTGNFSPLTIISPTTDFIHDVLVADLNADGFDDVVASNVTLNSQTVILGNGNGTFQAPVHYPAGGANQTRHSGVGDMNNDGNLDIISANRSTNAIGVLLGNGAGSFAAPLTPSSGGIQPYGVGVADFNNDGFQDVVAAHRGSPAATAFALLLGNGTGNLTLENQYSAGVGTNSTKDVVVADFNGDGAPDAAIVNIGGDQTKNVGIFLNTTPVAETGISLDGAFNLVIEDIANSSNDTLTVSYDSLNNEIVVNDPNRKITTSVGTGNNTNTVRIPLGLISGPGIIVNTFAGDDVLTVDSSMAASGKPITYNGGNPTVGPPGDALVLSGPNSFTNVTHSFANAADGSVSLDGYMVQYFGLEPITDNLNAVNRVFTFLGGPEIVALDNTGGAADTVSTISSNLAESVAFINPTGSLTINLNGGDIFNFNSLDSMEAGPAPFSANLIINGLGGDVVNFPSAMINLGAGNANIGTTGGQPIQDINFTGGGIQTTGDVFLRGTGSILNPGAGAVPIEIVALNLVAVAPITVDLDTNVTNIEVQGGSGGVTIDEFDGLTIGGIMVPVIGVSATGGNISVSALGPITVNETVSNTGGGNVTVTAGGAGGSSNLLYVGDAAGHVGIYDLVTTATTPLGNLNAFGISQVIGIAYDPGSNAVLILDRNTQRVFTMNAVSGVGSLLFNTGGVTFQGGAVKNGLLYGIDENSQTVEAFSIPGGVNQGFVSGIIPVHSHGMGIDQATGQLYVGGSEIRKVDDSGNIGALVVNTGFTEDLEYFNGDFLAATYSNNVLLVNGVTGASSTYLSPAQVAAMGLTTSVSGVALSGGGSVSADLTLNANISASGGNGNVTLNATNSILQNSGSVSATGSGTVDYNASTGTSSGAITMADGTSATSGTGLISLDAKGNVQLSLLQTASAAGNAVTVTTTAGAITDADNNSGLDISAVNGGAILSAKTGVGATGGNATIEIDVINLDVTNTTSGGIFVTDVLGGLTLRDLNADGKSVNGVGGDGLITALSPLTIASSATTSGGMTYTATDSAGAGDNLTINAGVAVTDTTASLTFNAGDDFLLTDTASISAATTATINIDLGNADPGVGATANIFGALAAPGGASMTANGDNDIFNITGPSATALDSITAPVTVNGGGGTNNLNISDANDATPGDTATITHTTVEGFGGAPGTDYTYSNIANLDVTGTSATDNITTNLGTGPAASPTSFNGLVNVAVRGNGGADNMFLHVADSLTNASLDVVNLFGDAGGDNFGGSAAANRIRPVLATGQTQIIINGDAEAKLGPGPVNPGTTGTLTSPDHLYLDMTTTDSTAAVLPIVIVDTNGGYADAANTQSFRYNGIEDIDLYDNGVLTNTAIGDFYLRATDQADSIVFISAAQVDPVFRIRIGNLYYPTNGGSYGPYYTNTVAGPGGHLASNIFVYARRGNDTVNMYNTRLNAAFFGEDGDDILTGGYNNDLLVGGAGFDRLNGGSVGGNDTIWGDNFNPAVDDPNVASQTLLGGPDTINTFGGNDVIYGQGGNDTINTGNGNDYVSGGAGNDLIDGQGGDDRIYGGDDNDVMTGSDGNDLVAGNDGNDTLYGRVGNDILIGGLGQDIVNGNEGGDALVGDESNNGGSKSLSNGDAVDAALLALLLNWATPTPTAGNFAAKLVSTSGFGSAGADGSVDTLWGGTEADAFFGLGLLLDQAPDRGTPGYSPDLN